MLYLSLCSLMPLRHRAFACLAFLSRRLLPWAAVPILALPNPPSSAEEAARLPDLSSAAALEALESAGRPDALPPGRLVRLAPLAAEPTPAAASDAGRLLFPTPAASEHTGAAASEDADAADITLFLSTSVPEASLLAIAEEAAALGIPLVFSSLPMKPEPLWRAREEAVAAGLPWSGPWKPPASADAAAAARLFAPLVRAGASIEVDPIRWRRAAAALARGEAAGSVRPLTEAPGAAEEAPSPAHPAPHRYDLIPTPSLVFLSDEAVEVFPGDVRPLYALAWAAKHAEAPSIRRAAANRLAKRGFSEAADRLVP